MANRDRELLIPVGEDDNDATPKPSSSSSSHNAGQEVIASFYMFVLRFRVSIAKLLMFLSNLVGNILVKGQLRVRDCRLWLLRFRKLA